MERYLPSRNARPDGNRSQELYRKAVEAICLGLARSGRKAETTRPLHRYESQIIRFAPDDIIRGTSIWARPINWAAETSSAALLANCGAEESREKFPTRLTSRLPPIFEAS